MKCPLCGTKGGVKGTATNGSEVIRLRKCYGCGYVFYTSETDLDKALGASLYENYRYDRKKELAKERKAAAERTANNERI